MVKLEVLQGKKRSFVKEGEVKLKDLKYQLGENKRISLTTINNISLHHLFTIKRIIQSVVFFTLNSYLIYFALTIL